MDVPTSLQRGGLCWAMVFLLVVVSCRNPRSDRSVSNAGTPEAEERSNVMKSPPAMHLLQYWDNFNFESSVQASNWDKVEQKLVDFISLFSTVPDTVVQVAIWDMLTKTSKDSMVLDYFVSKYQHYLYDPNSPMRNEGYYEKVLSYLAEANAVSRQERMKYTARLNQVRKNQVGTVAADFKYLAKNGQYHAMHEGVKPYKMLVFYDPTCSHCTSVIQDLGQTPAVYNCVENGFLDVIAISLNPDKDSWKAYQSQIPSNWSNGFDENGTVIAEERYHIRAYPTIFLLDKTNRVLLKDAPLDVTLRYLVNLVSRN